MRNSRVIALVVASLVSTAAVAQAQAPASADRVARQEQRGVKVKGERGTRGARGRGGMLRGLELSEAERTKLAAIRARHRTEGQSLRTTRRPAMLELRAARLKGDTAAVRALRDRDAGGRTQLEALHDRQLAEIRGALSAENQRLFDGNVARRAEQAKQRVGGRRGAKGEHRGHQRARPAGTNG
jgi:Spy/CpxP family protein refolding chaperone